MLHQVIAAAFKSKGKRVMSKSDLTYVLSFDLKWFSHSMSKKVVETAIKKGLLTFDQGKLEPNFDLRAVEIPIDFRPDIRRIMNLSVFEEILELIAEKTSKDKSEIVSEINKRQESFGTLLSAEVVALLYAKELGINVKPHLERMWRYLFETDF